MSIIDEVAAKLPNLMRQALPIRAIPGPAPRSYRGRRGRRAAFYRRRGTARRLNAIIRRISPDTVSAFEGAMRAVLLGGVGWLSIGRAS